MRFNCIRGNWVDPYFDLLIEKPYFYIPFERTPVELPPVKSVPP